MSRRVTRVYSEGQRVTLAGNLSILFWDTAVANPRVRTAPPNQIASKTGTSSAPLAARTNPIIKARA